MITNPVAKHSPVANDDAQSPDLAAAYRSLQDRNAQLEQRLGHGRRWLWIAISVLVLVLAVVNLVHWWWINRDVAEQHQTTVETVASPQTINEPDAANIITVASQSVSQHLGLVGTVAPGSVINVSAPFAGTIESLGFTYGARVTQGQSLVRLDTSELESNKRAARITQIQAQEDLNQLLDWTNSSEVAEARRSLESARQHLGESRRRAIASADLYREGIISREELESSQDQLADAERSAAAAQDSLQAALRKGRKENLQVARLKLEEANYALEKINSELAMAEVRSPVNGVALMPQEKNQDDSKTVAVGIHVNARQVLLAIGDMETLLINSKVSELDINHLTPGLDVQITADALGKLVLEGQVATVGSQAVDNRERGLASYPITITLPVSSAIVRQRIRLGMHVEPKVTIYKSPSAIVIPETAIHGNAGNYSVYRLNPQTNQWVFTPVQVGRPLADGIEITQGLSVGDKIRGGQ